MKRINCYQIALAPVLVLAAAFAHVTPALSTPAVNSAVINTRVFDNCPSSTLITVNSYPTTIVISDDAPDNCVGFANLHNWRFSENGTSEAQFMNGDVFYFGADLVLSGPGEGEGGLMISPWFSAEVDGRFNVRTTDGEIAVFGGVLPFYKFSDPPHNLRYTKGEPIHLEMNYDPRSNTELDPGQIEYKITYRGQFYSSGILLMSGCNVSEQPIYGCYGILNFARVGGHLQALWQASTPPDGLIQASWSNIAFVPTLKQPTAVAKTSWGRLKILYR